MLVTSSNGTLALGSGVHFVTSCLLGVLWAGTSFPSLSTQEQEQDKRVRADRFAVVSPFSLVPWRRRANPRQEIEIRK
jgi:hypothetical protein